MSKYEEMSDFEINQRIARIVTDGDVIELDDMFPGPSEASVQVIYKVGIHGEFVDYCNKPSDAWPIIVDSKIDIQNTVSGKISCAIFKKDGRGLYREFYETTDENPLRAAMICFLKMKDVE